MVNPKKPRTPCLQCGKEPQCFGYRYCSNSCQHEYQYQKYIHAWKQGKKRGLLRTGVVSAHVKRYLRRKFNDKCCLCGWSKTNPKSGKVPLVADHIDGDWKNNTEDNLRLICPNCDSLQPTYAALNKGNGRKHRKVSNRVHAARLLLQKAENSRKK